MCKQLGIPTSIRADLIRQFYGTPAPSKPTPIPTPIPTHGGGDNDDDWIWKVILFIVGCIIFLVLCYL